MTVTEFDLAGVREQLARTIHENYLREQQGKMPPDDPAIQPWEHLREDLKESNRQQADQIPEKLRTVGYGLAPIARRNPKKFEFSPEEIEKLARMEHLRWMAEKLKGGWRYGRVKDAVQKTHPCLVLWEKLPESEKDKDRMAVRQIPELLAQAGFEVCKLERTQD
jgi:hypothetical protein